jgi:hypothetical protein
MSPWGRRFGPCLLASATLAGCMPLYHRAPAYRYDPGAARDVERRAQEWCDAAGNPGGVQTLPFLTDGCSLWPDGRWPDANWQSCCVTHDIAYWCGGPPAARAAADRALRECAAEAARLGGLRDYLLGYAMEGGVTLMGHPWWPTYYRWGYGHRFPAPYYGLDAAAGASPR